MKGIGISPFDISVAPDGSSPPAPFAGGSMAPRRGLTRRRFLQSTALAAGALAPPGRAATDLKLKKPIKIGCQTILSGPLGGYGEFMRKGAMLAAEELHAADGIGENPTG